MSKTEKNDYYIFVKNIPQYILYAYFNIKFKSTFDPVLSIN